jgi:hypothetical protein
MKTIVNKQKILVIMLILVILWASVVGYSNSRYGIRYIVFCKEMTQGESIENARSTLSRYGKFSESVSEYKGDIMILGIIFSNPVQHFFFGSSRITLVFIDNKLTDIRVPTWSMDEYRSICKQP